MDIRVENHGSLYLLRYETEAGRAWLYDHIIGADFVWPGAVACEPRYVADIVAGAIADGLEVR